MKEQINLDRETLKEALTNLIEEKPEFFKRIFIEIIQERIANLKKEKEASNIDSRKMIEKFILEEFKELGDVYRALA